MTKVNQDFTLYQGQSKLVQVPCVDEDENPIDLTGAEVHWYLLEDPADAIGSAHIHKATTLALDDKITLTLINGDSGELDAAVFTCVHTDSENLGVGEFFHILYETDALWQ